MKTEAPSNSRYITFVKAEHPAFEDEANSYAPIGCLLVIDPEDPDYDKVIVGKGWLVADNSKYDPERYPDLHRALAGKYGPCRLPSPEKVRELALGREHSASVLPFRTEEGEDHA